MKLLAELSNTKYFYASREPHLNWAVKRISHEVQIKGVVASREPHLNWAVKRYGAVGTITDKGASREPHLNWAVKLLASPTIVAK